MWEARDFQIRMQILDMDRFRMDEQYRIAKESGAPPSVLLFLIKERAYIQGRLDEAKAWVEASAREGVEYGQSHRVDGKIVPRLPLFGGQEAIEAALRCREGAPGVETKEVASIREWRHREDAQTQARLLDGHSPYIPAEERKPPIGAA